MDELGLSPELEQLERQLHGSPRPELSSELRKRVLGDVKTTLRRERFRDSSLWAANLAAVIVLWINVSWSAVRATNYHLRNSETRDEISAAAKRIHDLSPDLSEREALRMAFTLRAGS